MNELIINIIMIILYYIYCYYIYVFLTSDTNEIYEIFKYMYDLIVSFNNIIKMIFNLLFLTINENNDIDNNNNLCIICYNNKINSCCNPCGHTYCNKCIYFAKNCYICNNDINSIIKIYI
jgi:hypothetical protein